MTAVEAPRRLGPYELLVPIGAGGVATVYLARREVAPGIHRDVAIKILHSALAGEGSGDDELIEEARVAAGIRHPNVVALSDVGRDGERVFLVMDYVEGVSLLALLKAAKARGEKVPLPIAGRVLVDALAGLHAAHELRGPSGPLDLVHRDFTPHNVLVGVDGGTRLTDFGVAKTAEQLGLTRTGHIKGKVAYMAPEQALGRALDRRCDVWAAGAVAWEVLAGRRMIVAENEAAMLLKIVSEAPPRVSSVRADIPAELDAAIGAALESDLELRLPSADALRDRLLGALQATCGIADPKEVGAYVAAIAGSKLAALRDRATAASASIALRPSIAAAPAQAPRLARAAALVGAMALGALVTRTVVRSARTEAAPAPAESATSIESARVVDSAAPSADTVTPGDSAPAIASAPASPRKNEPRSTPRGASSQPRAGKLPGLAPPSY